VIRRVLLLAALSAVSLPTVARAQTPPAAPQAAAQPAEPPKPNNYADAKSWLCRPGRTATADRDACDIDMSTTVVAADGTLTRELFKPNANAPVDCFYVYPTISTDQAPNSDMNVDPAEMNVIKQQAARFTSVCKVYAPMYRQISLVGLRRLLATPGGDPVAFFGNGVQYDDVRDAWKYYVEHDNQGRGVVVIGHSQGAYILENLVKNEIEGKPIQAKMVSALILGATLTTPKGKDVGGFFQSIPLCHAANQTGCVINYSAFRATVPPSPTTLYGRSADPALGGSCTNPAALAGGAGELHAYLDTTGQTITNKPPVKPWAEGKTVDTPWVSVPGLLTGKCVTNNDTTYLEVTVNGNPADPRVDEIVGDVAPAPSPIGAQWGLHLIDVNLTMGNLIDIVGQQAKAYAAKAK
jgi:Protein of unknown function (DUF3089)